DSTLGRSAARTISHADVPARPTVHNVTSSPAAKAERTARRSWRNAARTTPGLSAMVRRRHDGEDVVGSKFAVSRDDSRHGERMDQFAHEGLAALVEVGRGFVQYEQLRSAQQAPG